MVGAVLGQMGLKKKTGLGMATLIIAANIPDIDAVSTLLGGVQHLAIRRGITHGPIAMLLLPLLLTGIMILFDQWQGKRGKRPADRLPIHRGWLLALAYVGCLSHPALDWLNSYGVRLLEPFSSQWFYGDSIFIIDIWIWAALIAGFWLSRRREKNGGAHWQRPAWISFAAVCAYIFANGMITGKAEAETFKFVKTNMGQAPTQVVANPLPIFFWMREVIFELDKGHYLQLSYSIIDNIDHRNINKLTITAPLIDKAALIRKNPEAAYFLFWSRMPFFIVNGGVNPNEIILGDTRFTSNLVSDRFSVRTDIAPRDGIYKGNSGQCCGGK